MNLCAMIRKSRERHDTRACPGCRPAMETRGVAERTVVCNACSVGQCERCKHDVDVMRTHRQGFRLIRRLCNCDCKGGKAHAA